MTQRIKTFLTLVLTMFALASFVLFGTGLTKVNAEAPVQVQSSFKMVDGVELKTLDTGMRFKVEMDEETFNNVKNNSNVKMYFIIAPSVFFDSQTDGQYMNMSQKILIEADDYSKFYKDGELYYANGCVFKMKPENLALNYTAVACIETDTDGVKTYEYATKGDTVRNVYGLVNTAILTEGVDAASLLKVYDFMGGENYPIKVSTTAQYNALVEKVNAGLDVSEMDMEISASVDKSGASFDEGKAPVADITIGSAADFKYFVENINSFPNTYVKITSDIDMNGVAVTCQASGDFYCTLDGQGHVIKNLDINQKLFENVINKATIKNLALVNVDMTSTWTNYGLFTTVTGEGLTFDNCYLQINAANGNVSKMYDMAIANEIKGDVTFKNTILDKKHQDGANGLSSTCIANIIVENGYSIGSTSVINGSTALEEFFYVNDGKGAVSDIIANGGVIADNGWDTSIWTLDEDNVLYYNDIVVARGPAKPVEVSDAETLHAILTDTTGAYTGRTVLLTADIDMAEYKIAAPGEFAGVLDGQGKVVSNLKYDSGVATLKGATIKNVAFIVTEISSRWANGLFGNATGAVLENVYIKAVATSDSRTKDYALFGDIMGDVALNNVVIDKTHGITYALFNYINSASIKFTYSNLYVIGNTTKLLNNEGNGSGTGTAMIDTPKNAVTAIQTAGLTTANGWNLACWTITEENVLKFGNLTVATGEAPAIQVSDEATLNAIFADTTGAYAGRTVVLTKDMDMSAYTTMGGGTFSGVLDGQGHVINNISSGGQIASLENATIKNLGFIVTGIRSNYNNGLFYTVSNSTIENCYVKSSACAWSAPARDYALFYSATGNVVVKNTIIDKTHANITNSFALCNKADSLDFSNVYSIGSTNKLGYDAASTAPVSATWLYTNDGAGALNAITTAGLTTANGWNTSVWSVDASGNLQFGVQTKVTVIAKA